MVWALCLFSFPTCALLPHAIATLLTFVTFKLVGSKIILHSPQNMANSLIYFVNNSYECLCFYVKKIILLVKNRISFSLFHLCCFMYILCMFPEGPVLWKCLFTWNSLLTWHHPHVYICQLLMTSSENSLMVTLMNLLLSVFWVRWQGDYKLSSSNLNQI